MPLTKLTTKNNFIGEIMKKFKKGLALSRSKGFTLIELLVVVAIIAILATIIIINVVGARAKATRSKVASDMAAASKIAAACTSFGGTLNNATSGAICDTTNISTGPEKTSATGDYPTLPDNFTISSGFSGGSANLRAPDNSTMSCTVKGCGAWSGAGGGGNITVASKTPDNSATITTTSDDVIDFTVTYSGNIDSCSASTGDVCSASGSSATVSHTMAPGNYTLTISATKSGATVESVTWDLNGDF